MSVMASQITANANRRRKDGSGGGGGGGGVIIVICKLQFDLPVFCREMIMTHVVIMV